METFSKNSDKINLLERDLEIIELVKRITECRVDFQKIKNKYQDFFDNLPIDNKTLEFLNIKELEKKKEKTYGKNSNNKGKRWTDTDKSILNDMFNQNKKVEEISEYLGRTNYAIECVLLQQGLIDAILDEQNTPVYIKKQDKNKTSWSLYALEKLILLCNNETDINTIIQNMVSIKGLTEEDIYNKLEQLNLLEDEDDGEEV